LKKAIKHHICYNPELCIEISRSDHYKLHHGIEIYDTAKVNDAINRWKNLSRFLEDSKLDPSTADARLKAMKAIERIREYELYKLLPNLVRAPAIYSASPNSHLW
jgi:hypothetical protein